MTVLGIRKINKFLQPCNVGAKSSYKLAHQLCLALPFYLNCCLWEGDGSEPAIGGPKRILLEIKGRVWCKIFFHHNVV